MFQYVFHLDLQQPFIFSLSHFLQSTSQNRNSVRLARGRGDIVDGLFWLPAFFPWETGI